MAECGEVAVLRRDELGHIDPGGWDLLVRGRKDGHGLCLHFDVVVSCVHCDVINLTKCRYVITGLDNIALDALRIHS